MTLLLRRTSRMEWVSLCEDKMARKELIDVQAT
jgi:hypothetical protein